MKKRRRRIYLTHAEKAVMWDRWKQGESLHAIARRNEGGPCGS